MNKNSAVAMPVGFGLLAFAFLLAIYFAVLALLSGWNFTLSQFSEFWYYLVPLAAGFGLQVALFVRLRILLHQSAAGSRGVVAASGTTSTAAMISSSVSASASTSGPLR